MGSASKQDFVATISKLMASLRVDTPAQSVSSASTSLSASLQALNAIDQSNVSPTAAPGALLNYSA
jgi:hypothetical protein